MPFWDRAARQIAQSLTSSAGAATWAIVACMACANVAWSADGSRPLPLGTDPVLAVLPQPEETPAPPAKIEDCDEEERKPTPCTPAAKMKVRRDPVDNVDVFNCLTPKHPHCVAGRDRPDVVTWMNPTPYGQYVFLHHDPLLFEDIPAERYGEAFKPGVQPVVSLAKFVGAVPILPYKIAMNHYAAKDYCAYYAYDHHYNLRPGVVEGAYLPDYYIGAPYPKARLKASLIEIGAATGVVFFLP